MEIKNEKGEVVRTNRISLLLEKMKQRGLFNDIIRYRYTDYDINESLQMIEILGKSRTQKFVIDDENRFTYTNGTLARASRGLSKSSSNTHA